MVHCYVIDLTSLGENIIREPGVRQWGNAGSEKAVSLSKSIFFHARFINTEYDSRKNVEIINRCGAQVVLCTSNVV